MHLFRKHKKNDKDEIEDKLFDEQYSMLKEYADTIMRCCYAKQSFLLQNSKDIATICDDFLNVAENIDRKKVNKRIAEEAKKNEPNNIYPYHPNFQVTCFPETDVWQKVIETVQNISNRVHRLQTKSELFIKKYDDIPNAKVNIAAGPKLKRNLVMYMPELKYSSVGKSFNRDKLLNFIVIDTETTGLKATSDRIIQLTAVRFVEWTADEIWNSYIKIDQEIPNEATEVNGITNEMLKDKPKLDEVAKSFEDFIGTTTPIVGYNLPFDLKFLYASGISFIEKKRKYYDVLPLAKKVLRKDLDSFTLENVASYYGIIFPAHNSIYDCLATGEVFDKVVHDITKI